MTDDERMKALRRFSPLALWSVAGTWRIDAQVRIGTFTEEAASATVTIG